MEKVSLNDLNLHDSDIVFIGNDTQNDKVIIFLDYINDYETCETSHKKLIFNDCYKLIMNMNFGVIGSEPIREGYEIYDSEMIEEVKKIFPQLTRQLSENLCHYIIETNSTNSKIEIVSAGIEFKDIGEWEEIFFVSS